MHMKRTADIGVCHICGILTPSVRLFNKASPWGFSSGGVSLLQSCIFSPMQLLHGKMHILTHHPDRVVTMTRFLEQEQDSKNMDKVTTSGHDSGSNVVLLHD